MHGLAINLSLFQTPDVLVLFGLTVPRAHGFVLSNNCKKQGKEKKPNRRKEKESPVFSSQTLQEGAGMKAKLSRGRRWGIPGLSLETPDRKDLLPQSHMSQRERVLA